MSSFYNQLILMVVVLLLLFFLQGCKKDEPIVCNTEELTPYELVVPQGFPPITIPSDNPMTVQGVELGKKLFYDPRLSGDNTQSCASCHIPAFSFSDSARFSTGIIGVSGTRNAMAIVNLAFSYAFFWDGRAATLEEQALQPVTNPIEMNATWPDVLRKINLDSEYKRMFKLVYGVDVIDSMDVARALAQFERTMISGNSKYDNYTRGQASLSSSELRGAVIFMTERGDCFHCHGTNLHMGFTYENNGLQAVLNDLGRGGVTGVASDMGLFKPPTLRNIELTAPYMHDGRFNTLEEVVEFYNSGVNQSSPNISALMTKSNRANGQLGLTEQEKADLVAFLKTLTDTSFINNSAFLPN